MKLHNSTMLLVERQGELLGHLTCKNSYPRKPSWKFCLIHCNSRINCWLKRHKSSTGKSSINVQLNTYSQNPCTIHVDCDSGRTGPEKSTTGRSKATFTAQNFQILKFAQREHLSLN